MFSRFNFKSGRNGESVLKLFYNFMKMAMLGVLKCDLRSSLDYVEKYTFHAASCGQISQPSMGFLH